MKPFAGEEGRTHLALAAVLAAFVAVKLRVLVPTITDENLYFYLAERMGDGAMPYRDFFHAHPPLHLPPAALVFWLSGGFSLLAGRAIPALAAALAGFFLYRAGRSLGRAEGVLACAIFLFAFDPLRISSHYVGANLAAMWAALGLERLTARRPAHAGAAFALGACTLLNVAPAGVGAAAAVLLVNRSDGLRFVMAGALCFGAINALCFAAFGSAYVEQVYLFHLSKSAGEGALPRMIVAARENPWIAYGALAGLAAVLLGSRPASRPEQQGGVQDSTPERAGAPALRALITRDPLVFIAACGALGSLIFLASLAQLFNYYFEILFVCLAPIAALGVAETGRRVQNALRARSGMAAVEAAIFIAIIGVGVLPRWISLGQGKLSVMSWEMYLWPKNQRFEGLEGLVEQVRARSGPDDTLFGDYLIAPLVAVLADRRIALDEADTNVMRLQFDLAKVSDLIRDLDADPPRLILTRGEDGLASIGAFRSWIEYRFTPVYSDSAPDGTLYTVWGND